MACSPKCARAMRMRPISSTRSMRIGQPFAARRQAEILRPHADLDPLALGQPRIAARELQRGAADISGAAFHARRQHVHARRADEIADEGVRRSVEQFVRRSDLHHRAVIHHDHRLGEGQRLGLVVRHVDHGAPDLRVELLQLGAQLPFQLRIDDGQRLVEQDRGHVFAHEAAAERDLLLGVGGQAARAAIEIGSEIEHGGHRAYPPVDFRRADPAVLQREGQVLVDASSCRRRRGTGTPGRCCAARSGPGSRSGRRTGHGRGSASRGRR